MVNNDAIYKWYDLGEIMDVKDVFRTIVLEVSEEELAEMCGSIKKVLVWFGESSNCAVGTTKEILKKDLLTTYNELYANLRYMRE